MKAAVFEREGKLTLKTVPIPQIERPDQVLIRVEAVSICGTDVHITAVPPGYPARPNTILGHEFVGEVEAVGSDVMHLAVGDRVVVNPNNYCGTCVYCRKNLPNECEHMEALGIDHDGAFAQYCRVHAKVAYKVSRSVPVEEAACCEPLACAINALNKVNVLPGSSAAIIGGGPIGLMIAMLLRRSGADKLYMLEVSPYRIEFAQSLGIVEVIDPKAQDAMKMVYEQTEIGADLVFDVTGSQMASAVDLVRKGGKVVLFGVNKLAESAIKQCEVTTKEIGVLGTWLANATFPEAVRVLEARSIDISKLVTDVMELDQVHEGIDKLAAGRAIKVVVKP